MVQSCIWDCKFSQGGKGVGGKNSISTASDGGGATTPFRRCRCNLPFPSSLQFGAIWGVSFISFEEVQAQQVDPKSEREQITNRHIW